ncbi:TLC domain-containing protein, partial [Rhizodiscina lignyota]
MRDPFPLPAPAALKRLVEPFSSYFSLTTLPLHIHELLFATLLYTFIQLYVSPLISPIIFPKTYPKLNKRTKLNWDVHVVSIIQSVLISALSFWVMAEDQERKTMPWLERVHGYTPAVGMVAAFGCGYFLWDLMITTWNVSIFGVGMWAHAFSALTVFSLGFRPFLYYYCPTFLLYELSSPFLNIHWFLDKLDMTGSLPQFINGFALLGTFAGCRLIWGTYSSIWVFTDVYRAWRQGMITPELWARDAGMNPEMEAILRSQTGLGNKADEVMIYAAGRDVPTWLALSYLASNITLNTLNWYWFAKMIATVRKRFDPPFGTRKPDEKE